MFEENDRALRKAGTVFKIIIIFFAVISLVIAIVLAVLISWACIFATFVGWGLCWLAWVFCNLYMSDLRDIKFIRNKLYGIEDYDFDDDLAEEKAELEEAKLALEELIEKDMITQEEYEEQKRELDEREKNLKK
ncbi:MAG: hypothetical protein NC033_00075 [Clostridiales bacterium]|nr:hypothetical protein [Clostridiales bacterium]